MEQQSNEPSVWAGLARKISDGNYGSKEISVGISGVPVGSTPEQVQAIMNSGKLTLDIVIEQLAEKLVEKLTELNSST